MHLALLYEPVGVREWNMIVWMRKSPIILGFWTLVPIWWHCLERFRRFNLAEGSVSLWLGFESKKPHLPLVCSPCFVLVIETWALSSLLLQPCLMQASSMLSGRDGFLCLWNGKWNTSVGYSWLQCFIMAITKYIYSHSCHCEESRQMGEGSLPPAGSETKEMHMVPRDF